MEVFLAMLLSCKEQSKVFARGACFICGIDYLLVFGTKYELSFGVLSGHFGHHGERRQEYMRLNGWIVDY